MPHREVIVAAVFNRHAFPSNPPPRKDGRFSAPLTPTPSYPNSPHA